MGGPHHVRVSGIPSWVDTARLLGEGDWSLSPALGEPTHVAEAMLGRDVAADVQARLRRVGLGGSPIQVAVSPPLPRPAVRAARTTDAARRRDTTPGFTRVGARAQGEGRYSLTPEALALGMAREAQRRRVVDVCAGAGGNAIAFARAGCPVLALEPDADRRRELRHNLRVYGVPKRVTVRAERLEEAAAGLSGDLLFADPPWGEDYDRIHCGPEDLPLLGTVLEVLNRFREGWLKLPPSFDVGTLPGARPHAVFGLAPGDFRRVKFLWVRLPGGNASE